MRAAWAVLAVSTGLAIVPAMAHAASAPASSGQDAVAFQITPGHTGASPDPVGPEWTKSWTKTLGAEVSYPLLADGRVFVVVDSTSPSIYAFDAATGAQDWQVTGGVNGIAYNNGSIFAQSGDFVSAYNAATGVQEWSSALPDQYSFSSAPTASNGIVYTDGAGSGGTMYALSEATGALLWTSEVTNGDDSSPAVGPAGVYGSYACDLTQAFNPTSGAALWHYYNNCEGGGGQTAVLADRNIYLRDLVLNATTGAVVSSLAAGPPPAVDGSNVYLEDGGTLKAQTVASGNVLWSFTGDGHLDSPPIVDHGVVYEGSSSGELYGLSAATGQQLWSYDVGTAIEAGTNYQDSFWGLAEGDDLLAVPAGDTLTVFADPASVPAVPTAVTATPSGTSASVHWTVPANNGSAITDFTITEEINGVAQTPVVIPAGAVGSATDPTPGATDGATVTGLPAGASDIFGVGADNGGGQGPVTDAPYAPTITSAATAALALGLAGSFTVTTTANPTAALKEAGALPSGVTFTDNGDGTATLAGTPAAGTLGTYPLTLTATNGVGTTATQSFVLTVAPPIIFTNKVSATFSVGQAGSFTFAATGSPAPTFSKSGVLPDGVFLSSAGVLSGIPVPGTTGSYPLTVTASNGLVPSATQSFTLTVDSAPIITSVPSTAFALGQASSFTVTTTADPTPTLQESGALPKGVTFSDNGNGSATLAGTPAAGTLGTYPLTFAAANGVGTPAAQRFLLTVGTAPTFTNSAATTFTVGTAGSFAFTATGSPAPAFSEFGPLPFGVSLSYTGALSGTPGPGTTGTYPITVVAANGVVPSATQSFILTVDGAPTITSSQSTTFVAGSPASFAVRASGTPVAALTESGTLPSGIGFADNGNGTATLGGTAVPGTFGVYPVTFTATNGVGTPATQSFVLTIGEAPTITNMPSATFTAGLADTFTFQASAYPPATWYENGQLPSGVSLSPTGVLSGTPALGTTGTYAIIVTASNGLSQPSSQSFVLTVDGAPVITSAAAISFNQGTSDSFAVTATGLPAPALSVTGALPSGVIFTDNGNGSATLAGTPAAGTDGTYPLTITAGNGVGTNATQSFVLTVGQAPSITSAARTIFTAGSPGSFTVTATGSPVPTFTESGALPSGVIFTAAGELSGTPGAGTAGTYPITITASNGIGPGATQSFGLVVAATLSISSADSTTFTAQAMGSFLMHAVGFPVPTFSETGALPPGVTLSSGGLLSGTPAAGSEGVYPIVVTASNGTAPDATQDFTLSVGPFISTTTLPSQGPGKYHATLTVVGGLGSDTWTISAGALPPGLSLDKKTGVVSGKAKTAGTYSFTVQVTVVISKAAPKTYDSVTKGLSITIS